MKAYQSFEGIENFAVVNKLPPPAILSDNECYAYPMHEVFVVDGEFRQTRTSPNWQGGCMTLANCRHRLRSTREPKDWEGVIFAGFSPKINGRSYLIYMACVDRAFASNYELGCALSDRAKAAKYSSRNELGDIHEPAKRLSGAEILKPRNYIAPVGNVRYVDGKWKRDVHYRAYKNVKREPAVFLMGHVHIFTRPMWYSRRDLYRSGYKTTEREFIMMGLAKEKAL